MIRALISPYLPSYPATLIYMLQNTEYKAGPYLQWYWRTQNFTTVMQRRGLDRTKPARLLLSALWCGITVEVLAGLVLIYLGGWQDLAGGIVLGLALIIAYPVVWAHLLVLPLVAGRELSTRPQRQRLIQQSEIIFRQHPGTKIAVAGSYGKTTMKELLTAVLSEGKKVTATPANKNVAISHVQFAKQLDGDEDILIIEYGEGAPGDVARFASTTHPTHAVITGLAPAHLDQYKTLQAAGEDIFSVAGFVPAKHLYVNGDSPDARPFLKNSYQLFSGSGSLGWKTSRVDIQLTGTSFTLKKGRQEIALHSGLVGRHQVGFLAFAAALALELGLTPGQVSDGLAKTRPVEHRMQPYRLGGAWIVDDTYNGNLEGIRAGTGLLKEIKAKRKIYVTPGLVDQGAETEQIHREAGRLIAAARPDIVVLMRNSVTGFIREGLETGKFKGEIRTEDNPLEFYTNLAHFVASGDLVVMQNDWTDNYA
ncbi:MAG TPA: Mur ligase family protein [Candidatus Saccharimonadales bacterium]|nr:Mur ligase family protein [Candidatus Saccharimonadales bacterium]